MIMYLIYISKNDISIGYLEKNNCEHIYFSYYKNNN